MPLHRGQDGISGPITSWPLATSPQTNSSGPQGISHLVFQTPSVWRCKVFVLGSGVERGLQEECSHLSAEAGSLLHCGSGVSPTVPKRGLSYSAEAGSPLHCGMSASASSQTTMKLEVEHADFATASIKPVFINYQAVTEGP